MTAAPTESFRTLRLGDNPVTGSITCVMTRFELSSPLFLLPMYLDYRHIVKDAKQVTGFLRAAFLVENVRTCYTISFWQDPAAIPEFGTKVTYHVDAARRVFGKLARDSSGRHQLWSTKWRLTSVSHNLSWRDFDLQGVIRAAEHVANRRTP